MRKDKPLTIGILNDVHFDPYYDPFRDKDTFCRSSDPLGTGISKTKTGNKYKFKAREAQYGRYGCDPNEELI